MTQNSEQLRREIAELEVACNESTQSLVVREALRKELERKREELTSLEKSVATPATNQNAANVDQSHVQGMVGGSITGNTIYQFFGSSPPANGKQLLSAYLDALITDCNRLRLERMTEKRQTGGEHATTPTLKLQDVYTSLTTDGPDIVVDEMDGTLDELEKFCNQRELQYRKPDNYDPLDVRGFFCQDERGAIVRLQIVPCYENLPTLDNELADWESPDLIIATDTFYCEPLTLKIVRPELAFDAIRQHRRLVLLGEPGSGKSTVLRYLAVLLARKLSGEEVTIPGWEEVDSLPIPIFCPLGQVAQVLTETGNADEALWQTLGIVLEGAQPLRDGLRDYLKGALNRGGVILLCDGLDELPLVSSNDETIQPRHAIAQAIQNLARTAPQLCIVLTSRVKPYHASSDWRMPPEEDWQVRTIEPLAFGQVRTFIQSWYHALVGKADLTSADAAAARSGHLIGEIERYSRIHPLVESPLLLTMLTILHYNTDRIPRDRATLYHECVQLLLERWEPVRSSTNPAEERKLLARLGDIQGLELDQLRMVLHDLAFEAHNQPPTDDGRGLIDGEKLDGKLHRFFANLRCSDVDEKVQIFREVLEADAGLLQVPDHDRYAFPHLTFQEYLAACYLVDQMDKEQRSLAYERWCSPDAERWREVLLLMMGRLRQEGIRQLERDGAPWLEYLLCRNIKNVPKASYQRQRDLVLAALSYAEVEGRTTLANWDMGVEERIEEPLRDGLLELLAKPDPQLGFDDRVAAATVLGQIGDPRFPVNIDEWLNESFPRTFGNSPGYWCYVPAGTYQIGGWEEGAPSADITLPEYWIARFPVTVAQFRLFIEEGYGPNAKRWWTSYGWLWKQKSNRTKPWGWYDPTWTGNNQPVIGVTWYEIVAFVNWLDEQLADALPEGYRLRLPTEAEWEVAAAYDRTGQRRTYPWGEDTPTTAYAVFAESGLIRTAPIGCCPQGVAACGALDMAGNVWEWSCSHDEHYPQESNQIVEDFASEEMNTPGRSGSWLDSLEYAFCYSRLQSRPDDHYYSGQGFRVVVARCDGGA